MHIFKYGKSVAVRVRFAFRTRPKPERHIGSPGAVHRGKARQFKIAIDIGKRSPASKKPARTQPRQDIGKGYWAHQSSKASICTWQAYSIEISVPTLPLKSSPSSCKNSSPAMTILSERTFLDLRKYFL